MEGQCRNSGLIALDSNKEWEAEMEEYRRSCLRLRGSSCCRWTSRYSRRYSTEVRTAPEQTELDLLSPPFHRQVYRAGPWELIWPNMGRGCKRTNRLRSPKV